MRKNFFQKTRTGKIQQWSIWVVEKGDSGHPEIWIEHGQVDGKKQTTNDIISTGVNIGKANETTPLQQATLTMERKITKQLEKGYRGSVEELNTKLSIDFDKPLPKELCFYKPKNSIEANKIKKLEANRSAVYTVKRDGMMHIVRKTQRFGVEIYSRRMDLVTDKYPHLIESLSKLPNNSILLGEIVLIDDDGKDDFNAVSSICRSDPEKAIERQEELGYVSYYIFDVAYWDGRNTLVEEKYADRREMLIAHMSAAGMLVGSHLVPAEVIFKPHAVALREMRDRGLEGLVVWDGQAKMEKDQAFTLNGKAYRPNVLWKSKPKYEDDFIVRFDPDNGIGEYGKGKNNDKLKSVFCYQLDDDGNEIFLGKCGGGLSDDLRAYYTNPDIYPRVWRIEFDSIQEKTGALRFPVFNADRTDIGDKSIEECTLSDKSRQAREGELNE